MESFYIFVFCLTAVRCDIYNVQINTDRHVNLVDERFLSFAIDPTHLFASIGKYNSKECSCMASALAPAYLRVAGPSTSRLTFANNSIVLRDSLKKQSAQGGDIRTVAPRQWQRFAKWANNTELDIVFALNSVEKTESGMWDPNTALSVLTAADTFGIDDIFWQLGYECKNQSIEEYFNDLETLRVIIETFPRPRWKVVGGDVTECLQVDSKSDFKDYVTLSNDMMDAIMLNGNSSSRELERMAERDRAKLLRLLTRSDVPLWLTEHSSAETELQRAAEWLASLGFSARNGFSVHYRDLLPEELHEPTLSFYMALLFKNLVGPRVLDVAVDISKATLFAHCTSLHHKPISGALTFYGANMDDEPARFSLKMSKREEGGDIMQFILGHDENENIVVNSHAMYYEGDIRPVVKRVRPYKTLLITLPPKSFGFWVLANTQIEACRNVDEENGEESLDVVTSTREPPLLKVKRSLATGDPDPLGEIFKVPDNYIALDKNAALKDRVDSINRDLKKMQSVFQEKMNNDALSRLRRHVSILRDQSLLHRNKIMRRMPYGSTLINKLLGITDSLKRPVGSLKKVALRKRPLQNQTDIRNPKQRNEQKKSINANFISRPFVVVKKKNVDSNIRSQRVDGGEAALRKRRSISGKGLSKFSQNSIDLSSKESLQFSKVLQKIKKISDIPLGIDISRTNNDYEDPENDGYVNALQTNVEKDDALIDIDENPNVGLITSTFEDLLSILSGLHTKFKRVWDTMTLLE
ncbi:unnamed protein product [Leptosia nina]|uniref:Heparanase n=1 Tax=Leptosia nina TaxID=320188 RepID=A0AAV1IUJ6_9NEOP